MGNKVATVQVSRKGSFAFFVVASIVFAIGIVGLLVSGLPLYAAIGLGAYFVFAAIFGGVEIGAKNREYELQLQQQRFERELALKEKQVDNEFAIDTKQVPFWRVRVPFVLFKRG